MATDVIIVGALGRMGIEIARAVLEDKDMRIAGSVECANHCKAGQDYGQCAGIDIGGVKISSSIEQTSVKNAVVIDFSSVQSTRENLKKAADLKMPMVVGTTGTN